MKFKGGQVRPGLSGSPVFNQRTGKVCGVVKFTLGSQTDLGGGAIPTTVIFSRWPELERQNRKFHWRDGRWTKALSRISEGESELARHLSPRERENRRDLLDEVKEEVAHRLRQSLHRAVLINLLKEVRPQEVKPLWDIDVKIGMQEGTWLPPETEIIDVFDEGAVGGKLLILGTPGAGKTTTLLHLARDLAGRAEINTDEPMPVLLNLSSWKDDDQPIAAWLVAELHLKYGVRKDLGQRWLDERRLLPLLDGLDELESTRLEKCVEAINRFQRDCRPKHLVVCCRLAEFQNSNAKLQLNAAIQLQPLTDEQIHHYLMSAESLELWETIQADAELLELARSPLLLSTLTLAYGEGPIQGPKQSSSTPVRLQYLFNVYIQRMLSRESKGQRYSKEKTLHWLAWLAKRLREQAQAEFLIERLQPVWLQSAPQKLTYRVGVVLIIALTVVAYYSLENWLMEWVPRGKVGLVIANRAENWLQTVGHGELIDLAIGIILGLLAGLIIGLKQTIKPIETLKWSSARAWREMVLGLRRWSMTGLEYGAYMGLIAGLIGGPMLIRSLNADLGHELAKWGKAGQISGVIAGLIAGVAAVLIAKPRGRSTGPLWGWRTIRSADALISGLILGLAIGVSAGPLIGCLSGLSMGALAGLSHRQGYRPVFRVSDALIVGLIGWLISGMLTWLTGGLLLKGLRIGLAAWLDLWLPAWLGVAAAAGLVAWLVAKLTESPGPVELPQGESADLRHWLVLRWRRWLMAGVAAALLSSLIMGGLIGSDRIHAVRAVAVFSNHLGMGVIIVLSGSAMLAVMAGVGVLIGALFGALFGAFNGGLTGPDIERRTMPNQGIRQSAINAGWFALVGGLILGTIWGLLNLTAARLMTGLAPDPWDWLRYWLAGVLFLGLINGLVPAAACLQHFTLRFILWCNGSAPWHYARFLNYATERMLLQRVGGRYRFIHNLLRDHFAEIEPKHVKSG